MKKNIGTFCIVALIASAALMWLWFYLGFKDLATPLGYILTIIWWVLVALGCACIRTIDETRQERMSTCYLRNDMLYNAEAGTLSLDSPDADTAVEAMRGVLGGMQSDQQTQNHSEVADDNDNQFRYACIVRTKVFDDKAKGESVESADDRLNWQGEVVMTSHPNEPIPFANTFELKGILAGLA